MSQNELQRVKVIENAVEARITVAKASELLSVSARQVQRLKSRYRPDTVEWVRHEGSSQRLPSLEQEAEPGSAVQFEVRASCGQGSRDCVWSALDSVAGQA